MQKAAAWQAPFLVHPCGAGRTTRAGPGLLRARPGAHPATGPTAAPFARRRTAPMSFSGRAGL